MTTFSTLMLCAVVGQVGGSSNFGSAIPVPQSSARRTIESPAIPASRFGAPTPAEPSLAESAPRSVLATAQASDLNVSGSGNNFAPNTSPTSQATAAQFNVAPTSDTALQSGFQPRASLSGQQDSSEQTAAMRLIRQAFPTPDDAGDETTQLSLRDVIAVTKDRGRRTASIKTYWEAATLLADWQFASEEYEVIRQLSATRDAAQQATLTAAQTASQARLIEAQMAANSARFALGEIVPARRNDAKPLLPIDTPLSGKYNTEFETLFAARVAPPGLRRIHETLPLRQDLVEARATAVFAADDALRQQLDSYQNGRAALAEVLHSLNNLRAQRGAFLGALRDYNLDIAEYALGTSLPNDTPEKVVAMMIKAPNGRTNVSTTVPSGSGSVLIAPAGATSPTFISPSLPPSQLAPAQGSPTQLPPPQATPASRAAVLAPTSSSPTPASPPNSQFVSPNPRVADQSGAAGAEIGRPTTERVLGTLRDVTNQTPATILQPTVGNSGDATTPAASSRFGGTQFPTNPSGTNSNDSSPTGASRFGASEFGSNGATDNDPIGATISNGTVDSSTIASPPASTPVLPPLTP